MPLFDSYIFIDWSAKNSLGRVNPSPDSIWVGELTPSSDCEIQNYFRSRHDAIQFTFKRLLHHIQKSHRVLIGFDFSYGYPYGLSLALGINDDHLSWWGIWKELFKRIKDGPDNASNRFEVASCLNEIISSGDGGPFWGVPAQQSTESLLSNRPEFPFVSQNKTKLEHLRITESDMSGVQETWKLFGAGSVGSQTLVGIPYLCRLRCHTLLKKISRVWPFETGFTPTPTTELGACIVHAEIWPGIVEDVVAGNVSREEGAIRDQIQVREMCKWAARLDHEEKLCEVFDKPKQLDFSKIKICVQHEGWILGA